MSHEEVCLHGATCLRVDLSVGSEQHCVLTMYRSSSLDLDLGMFTQDLESYCGNRPRDWRYWLVGDINCCVLPDNHSLFVQHYLDVQFGLRELY